MKRKRYSFRAAAVAVLIAAAGTLAGCMTMGRGKMVGDSQGRLTYLVAPDLRPQLNDGAYDHYTLESPSMKVYVVAVEAPSEQVGRALAFDTIGRDFGVLKLDGTTSFGEWRADAFKTEVDGGWAGIAYQSCGDTHYGMVVFGGSDTSSDTLPEPVAGIIGSFQFGAAAGVVFHPAGFAELEDFIDRTAESFGGSIFVAAVENGEVVYRYAAHVRNDVRLADRGRVSGTGLYCGVRPDLEEQAGDRVLHHPGDGRRELPAGTGGHRRRGERLKQQPGADLAVSGPSMASALARLGLIDEYRLVLYPVVVYRRA